MTKKSEPEIQFSFHGKIRDFLIILSLLGVGGNLVWCWEHGDEIKKLRERVNGTSITTSLNQANK